MGVYVTLDRGTYVLVSQGGVNEYQPPKQAALRNETKQTTRERREAGFKALNLAAKWYAVPRTGVNHV